MNKNSPKDTDQKKKLFDLEQKLSKINDEKKVISHKNILLEQKIKTLDKMYNTNLNSASYQLGHLLLHDTRSLRSLVTLPKKILNIWRSSKHRIDNGSINDIDLKKLDAQNSNPKPLSIKDLKKLKIACIMDTFSFDVFGPEANFFQLTPQGWREEMEASQPNMLLVESAWRGKDDLWRYKIHILSQELVDIIVYCREKGIATVFWNKEDPYHFNDLIDTAQYFDFVFTTDIDCIPEYKSHLGHDNVFLLPFACQPKLHNPIEKFERKNAFVFAGAYYPHFPKRMKVFEDFIEHLVLLGDLDIYDRHFGNTNTSNIFPKKYHPLIRGTLAYNEIDKAYKGYKYALNLNSITSSPTMFSRRVFELMASNTLVLSNYAEGIHYLFGDLIIATDSGEELTKQFLDITKDTIYEKKIRLLALRKVMIEHTAESRLSFLASIVYQHEMENSLPHITMVAYVKEEEAFYKVHEAFTRQDYDNKHLTIVHAKNIDLNSIKSKGIQFISETKNKDFTKIKSQSEYIAGIAPDDYYGKNYLLDLALATRYSEVSIIGKKAYYDLTPDKGLVLENAGSSYHIVKSISARSSIIKKEKLLSQSISEWSQTLLSHIYKDENILSIDEFNYARNTQHGILTDDDIELLCDLESINTGIEIDSILQNTKEIKDSTLKFEEGELINGGK